MSPKKQLQPSETVAPVAPVEALAFAVITDAGLEWFSVLGGAKAYAMLRATLFDETAVVVQVVGTAAPAKAAWVTP